MSLYNNILILLLSIIVFIFAVYKEIKERKDFMKKISSIKNNKKYKLYKKILYYSKFTTKIITWRMFFIISGISVILLFFLINLSSVKDTMIVFIIIYLSLFTFMIYIKTINKSVYSKIKKYIRLL